MTGEQQQSWNQIETELCVFTNYYQVDLKIELLKNIYCNQQKTNFVLKSSSWKQSSNVNLMNY